MDYSEIEVPAPFLCPISLHLMREPVTVSTGITYDRESIERWLFSCKNFTCPVTKQQILQTQDLTPNHTLQRLIQNWCTQNHVSLDETTQHDSSSTIEKAQVVKLLNEAKRFSHDEKLKFLKWIKTIALESESNKQCLESAGAIDFLASTMDEADSTLFIIEAGIELLFKLNPSIYQLKYLINNEKIHFFESLFHVLRLGNQESRTFATLLLKSSFGVANPTQLSCVKTEYFVEISRVIRDKISQEASKAALKLLVDLCSRGRNQVRAVEAGLVLNLIDLLIDSNNISERRICELILIALDRLCGCAEGRAALLSHGAAVAVISKKILRVSCVASDRAVKILATVCRYSATLNLLQEMLVVGAVSKLCLVLQVDNGASNKAKERASEILKLHTKIWKNSPCIPVNLLSNYP
ncbi:E3 ubiquitin-protein ligase PUB23-like [Arachis stenosperma]|uniref:E3 ubiquitin-protein ligase PUB23-like n=1 Tax=Arachis stenosperma TaxID=217475 RepID=UPI0025ABA1E3|nr:E3 ubiquitin-protein ligase PUB23-like [Arachis stenosperma]